MIYFFGRKHCLHFLHGLPCLHVGAVLWACLDFESYRQTLCLGVPITSSAHFSLSPPPHTHTHSKNFLFFPPGIGTLGKMLDSLSLLRDRGPLLISFCFLGFIGWIQIGINSPLQKIHPQNALVSETKTDLLLIWRRKGKPPLTMSNGAPPSSLTVSDIDASPSVHDAGYHWENPSQTREWQGILPERTLSACLNNNRLSGHKS